MAAVVVKMVHFENLQHIKLQNTNLKKKKKKKKILQTNQESISIHTKGTSD